MKITLPVSKQEVELAVLTWPEAKDFFKRAAEFLAEEGRTTTDWMEKVLRECYPAEVQDLVFKAAPDAMALYNDTVRYNKSGQEAVKNSSRSGDGQPTQTA